MKLLKKALQFIKKYKLFFITTLFISAVITLCYYVKRLFSKEIESVSVTNKYPPIRQFHNILSAEECEEIIRYSEPKLTRSLLDDGLNGKKGSERTSSQAWIKPTEIPCLDKLSKYVSSVTGYPMENQEEWQLLRYYPGEEYKPHYDAANPNTEDYEEVKNNEYNMDWGQRVYTFFIYLNDVPEGGETLFPQLDLKFKPHRGRAILWENLTEDRSICHTLSEHGGMPVKKGVKWAINVWIREKATN